MFVYVFGVCFVIFVAVAVCWLFVLFVRVFDGCFVIRLLYVVLC